MYKTFTRRVSRSKGGHSLFTQYTAAAGLRLVSTKHISRNTESLSDQVVLEGKKTGQRESGL